MDQIPLPASEAVTRQGNPVARAAFDPAMKPIYAGLALSWAALLLTMPLVGLSFDPVLTAAFLIVCAICCWAAACLRLRGFMRIAAGIEAWALFSAACLTGILGTYVAARCAAPYADGWMAAADRLIAPGLGWRATMLAITSHPWLMQGANHAYASMQWQSILLILLCCATGQPARGAGFVLRWLIALALVCALFAFLPCLGPYAHYHIAHDQVPLVGSSSGWRQPELLERLRAPGALRLDPSALAGIVEFPSFHTAAGVLFAWGFWSIRWARWPMLALNVAMIAAAVPVGGHYYIDIIGGALVAWVAIALPRWCSNGLSISTTRHVVRHRASAYR